ncbi:hypothetical protein D3C85_699370 [compost metagenome]
MDGRVQHYPHQPGDQEDQADAAQGVADRPANGIADRELEQRHPPNPPQDVDEGNRHEDPQQGVGQSEKTLFIGTAALRRQRTGGLEHVLQHGADEHGGNQQDGGEQRTTQHLLVVVANADQVDYRDQHHQQNRPVPDAGKDPQRLAQCRLTGPLGQWQNPDHLADRPAQANHQQAENDRRRHPGKHRDTAGEVVAQAMGDLRAGQGVAEGNQEPHQEQGSRAVLANDAHRTTFVPDVEQHHQRQQQRSREQAGTGGVGQAQCQRPTGRGLQKQADIERHGQADRGRQGVAQQVVEQRPAAFAGTQHA